MSEGPQIYSESNPMARKEHSCCECRGTIFSGEKYHLFNGLWDGEWSIYKTCQDCQILRTDIDATIEYSDELAPFGQLYEDVFECRDNADWIRRFMDTRRKRNAPESHKGWMERVGREMNEKQLTEKP